MKTAHVQRFRPTWPVRLFNAGAPVLSHGPRLEAAALIERARRETGLDAFGDPDPRPGLDRLCRSLEQEARLTAVGRMAAHGDLLRILTNRLEMEAARRSNPTIARQEIRAPLLILGLPRTGTTLLHRLLAQDPEMRAPTGWEVMYPCPPLMPDTPAARARAAGAQRRFRMIFLLAPGLRVIHPVDANAPQECMAIMSHSLVGHQFPTLYHIPEYRQWLARQDMAPVYALHRRFLQHLQVVAPAPRRWLLKSPVHLLALDALFATYPDARVVQTHREPAEAMASLASLRCTLQGAFSDHVEPHRIGADAARQWSTALADVARRRGAGELPEQRFLDVRYERLLADPLAVVRDIYGHIGAELTEPVLSAMRTYLADQPDRRLNRHRYHAETFGWQPGDIERIFADYRYRQGLAAADPASDLARLNP